MATDGEETAWSAQQLRPCCRNTPVIRHTAAKSVKGAGCYGACHLADMRWML